MRRYIALTTFIALIFSMGYSIELAAQVSEAPSAKAAKALFDSAREPDQYKRALQALEAAVDDDPDDPDLSFYLGRSLFHDQQLEAADKVLSANIKKYPSHAMSHYVLGSVKLTRVAEVSLFRKVGMAKAALRSWQRAYELNPEHAESLYGVVEFYFTAPGMAGGDKEQGAIELARLESLSEPWANLSKASRAAQNEDFAAAEVLFKKAIEGIPYRAFPQLMLANTYVQQDKLMEALAALNTYRERERTWNDPGAAQIELMAARIYRGLGQQAEAKRAINLVFSSNPPPAIKAQAEQTLGEIEEMAAR